MSDENLSTDNITAVIKDNLPTDNLPTGNIPIENLPTEQLTPKEQRMESAGLTRQKAYGKLVEMCEAQVMTLDKFGGEHVAPDNPTQLRAAEMILKMRGDIRPETVIDNRVVNIAGIPAEVTKGLIEMVADVKAQLEKLQNSGQQTGEIIDVEVV